MTEGAHGASLSSVITRDTSSNGVPYGLKLAETPRLAGFALRIASFVVEKFGGLGVSDKLLNDSNMRLLRTKSVLDPPTFHPLVPPTSVELESNKDQPAGQGELNDLMSLGRFNDEGVDFGFPCVKDYHEAYTSGRITPLQVVQTIFSLADASNKEMSPPLLAFVSFNREEILQHAKESTERYARAAALSPLDGVPIAVKDEIDVVGYSTTGGTGFLNADQPAARDADSVQRLRAVGGLIVGKTNMHEIGFGITNCNPHFGTPRNPYNPNHFPGGSSGGSAAAVAAGFCPIALGADAGGSIRIPSSFCGLYGIKATYGRISRDGILPLAFTTGHLGPIGANISDLAIAYRVIAGKDTKDPDTREQPAVTLRDASQFGDLSGMRIGVYKDYFSDADADIVRECKAALHVFKERGAEIVSVEIPELEETRVALLTIAGVELSHAMSPHQHLVPRLSPAIRLLLSVYRSVTVNDYLLASRQRTRAIRFLRETFSKVDVLVTPTTACTAPEIRADSLAHGESDNKMVTLITRFAFLANITGVPGMSIPVGYDSDGLPVGLQLMAPWWHEHTLFRLATAHEQRFAAMRRRPIVYHDILAAAEKDSGAGEHDGSGPAAESAEEPATAENDGTIVSKL